MSAPLTPEQISEYADKWLKGTITPAEKECFDQWYNAQPPGAVNWPGTEQEAELQERLFSKVQSTLANDPETVSIHRNKKSRLWQAAAAIIVLLAGASGLMKWMKEDRQQPVARVAEVHQAALPNKSTDYARHLTLPDGSTVILHANSTLRYDARFSGHTREVYLAGEAYFDIQHDATRPFIIHTGAIKTTVLGTAFNIKAYPGAQNVTVSVTRGKVKVEDNHQQLAILTMNQELTCSIASANVRRHPVNVAAETAGWIKEDMAFDDVSFVKIVELLNRRYGVDIRFSRPAMQNCTIKAFFGGTEPLEKVLDALCTISNATYTTTDGHTILLDGPGCGE